MWTDQVAKNPSNVASHTTTGRNLSVEDGNETQNNDAIRFK
jgi:hypothetical protein